MAAKTTFSSPSCDDDAKALQLIEQITRNAAQVQQKVLGEILAQNAETEYLKVFNLDGATNEETFKSKVPMVTYEDIWPFIRRIVDGDESPILSAKPITEFICTSGTSAGEPKLLPFIEEERDRQAFLWSLITPIMNQYVKGLDKGKALYFMFTKSDTMTKGGIPARSALTSWYSSERFKNRPYNPYNVYTSPNEAICCVDTFQSMYTQLLCGLYEREQVLRVGAVFVTIFLRVIWFFQLNWKQLTDDIRAGSLTSKVTDTSIRERMAHIMRPDPNLADFIARECGKDKWEGIVTRLWPNSKYLDMIITGSMSQYIPILDYYSGGLQIASTLYGSSECYFGINLNPMCNPLEVSYTMLPNLAYFEFLPHVPNSPDPVHSELVGLVDVEIGKEYELLVTTYTGLCRYRVGDILRVTGFHNSAPQFQFIMRKNVLLSLDADKINEPELQAAVGKASLLIAEFNTTVVEYTSYADATTVPGHYVIYWELLPRDSANSPSDKVLDECCLAMEESFNPVYRQIRVTDKSIGPLEIRVVKSGTFEEVMNYAISRGATMSQYKTPRCVSSKPMMELLESRVVSKHFSPSLPHWTPE